MFSSDLFFLKIFWLDVNQESTNYKSLLGGKCLTNDNCRTLNARCLNNICTCPIGQFPIDSWSCLHDPGKNSTMERRRIVHSQRIQNIRDPLFLAYLKHNKTT